MADEPVDLGERGSAKLTVSKGVATWDGRETAEALEKRADDAMYEVKQHGRNAVRVAPAPSLAVDLAPLVDKECTP
jgi:PleD family two-component response regulator